MNAIRTVCNKKTMALLLLLISGSAVFAHATVIDIEKMNSTDSAALYLTLGFTHIIPLGFDHILFVLSLFLLNPKLKPVLFQATAFTVAHTVTLGLSMYKIITPPASIVEPLIALSIIYVALENIFSQKIRPARIAVVFLFGLVHGMGFASALGELGLPQNRFFTSLLLFNAGVELGQITVILAAWFLVAKWFSNKPWYRKYIVIPASVIIASVALYLLINRISFGKNEKVFVNPTVTETAMLHYNDSAVIKATTEIEFWRNRIQPNAADYTNAMRYAAALINRFHLTGNIADVKKSDSILLSVANTFKQTEAAPYLSLSSHAILQHQFLKADSFLTIAKTIGIKKYDALAAGFDVNFELGQITNASLNLKGIQQTTDYGYQFRQSKLMHYKGLMDSSISAMKAAYEISGSNTALQQAALSNLGDLYIHSGDLQKATDCFTTCIKNNASDMHSFTGLAWIALLHDNNDSLAEKILRFVASKTQSPEPLFKLIAVAQQRKNNEQEYQFVKTFEQDVSDVRYGNMYNKYLIQLYSGVLNNAAKAVTIAAEELQNRNTPQTNAWYAWTLFKNGQQEDALKAFKEKISGKPLEALELYWMGKLLKAAGKTSMATQYFYQAEKNKYDLNPAINNDLKEMLNL
jgi:hypothetical protein